MKISESDIKHYLAYKPEAEANSFIILNYGEDDTSPAVTYRISLSELSNMIINNHNLLRYSGAANDKNLTSVKYASSAYEITDSLGQFIDASDRTVLNSAVTNVGYDTTEKKITFSTRGGAAASVVTAATLKTDMALNNVDNKSSSTIRSEITSSNITTALGYTPLNGALKGTNNGVAELDANGKVPSNQLPSYVDDVIEGYLYNNKFYQESAHTNEIANAQESGKIYVDLTEGNRTVYRWSGSGYTAIPIGLALGETSTTAYYGDKGKDAYTHAVTRKGSEYYGGTSSNKTIAFFKIRTNEEGHVIAADAVQKSDITALGIPGSDTTYVIDGTYDAATNKVASVSTVTNAINALGTAASATVETSAIASASSSTKLPTSAQVATFVEGKGYYTKPVGGIPNSDLAETYIKLPTLPAEDGTYNLQVTISSGTPTYSWVPIT